MKFKKEKKKNENIAEQPSLTSEQIEILSSRIEQVNDDRSQIEPFDKSLKASAIRYAKSHKTSTIILGISALALIVVLVALIVYAAIEIGNIISKKDFEITMGEDVYKAKYEDVVIDDVLYIDMLAISDLCDMTYSGDASTRKFTLPNLQYVKFENDSEYAIMDGSTVNIGGIAKISDENCLIPYSFISKAVSSGISFKLDSKKSTISVTRIIIDNDSKGDPIYEEITFAPEKFKSLSVNYNSYGIDYNSVLSYIDPEDDSQFLLLVNKKKGLDKDYIPKNLVQLTCQTNSVNVASYYRLDETVANALYAMMNAMKNSGELDDFSKFQVSSSYRSYERQEERYKQDINKYMNEGHTYDEAVKKANEFLALPGQSEHQTGLCVDFVYGTKALTEKFEETDAFDWLVSNAHKFGFILRYPKDKVSITKYGYEPWHYRFVGRDVASRMYEAGICFEEYIEITSGN